MAAQSISKYNNCIARPEVPHQQTPIRADSPSVPYPSQYWRSQSGKHLPLPLKFSQQKQKDGRVILKMPKIPIGRPQLARLQQLSQIATAKNPTKAKVPYFSYSICFIFIVPS
ncbi:MAG: hypothetical protein KGS48_01080 [Bacteroidetes bacterium]|nr:hypothetical protein [Bacteroidota bacterium]